MTGHAEGQLLALPGSSWQRIDTRLKPWVSQQSETVKKYIFSICFTTEAIEDKVEKHLAEEE